jgi:hypothetical protein
MTWSHAGRGGRSTRTMRIGRSQVISSHPRSNHADYASVVPRNHGSIAVLTSLH